MISVVGILLIILVVPLLFVFGWIKFLKYLELKHPTWVGEGLRSRLVLFFSTSKYRAYQGNNPNKEVIPANIARRFNHRVYKIQNSFGIWVISSFGGLKSFVHNVKTIYNPHGKNNRTYRKYDCKNLEQSIPIHTDKSSIVDKDDSTKREPNR